MTKSFSDFAQSNRLVRDLLLVMLRPLVRILLRYCVPYRTVAETLKWVYVHESAQRVASQNTTVQSTVAMETGLCRKEVKKYLDLTDVPFDERPRRHERMPSVVNGWLHDPQFAESGQPKTLPLTGDGSFQALVRNYGADVSHTVVARELENRGLITQDGKEITLNVERLNDAYSVIPKRAMRGVVSYIADSWNGYPEQIPVFGAGKTIESLVSEWASELDLEFVVNELIAAGVIKVCGDDAVWLSELYVPTESTTLLEMIVHSVGELVSTIEHNLDCGRSPEGRLQQYVHFPGLSESDAAAFKSRLLDEWTDLKHRLMAEFQPLERPGVPHPPAPGVGIYYYVAGEEQNVTRKYASRFTDKRASDRATLI